MRSISAASALSSPAVAGLTMPSPLKRMAAREARRSRTWARLSAAPPAWPDRASMRSASACSKAPCSLSRSRLDSCSTSPPSASTWGSRTRATAHWQAAISSGGRMRPSLSSSIRSSVSLSNSMPRVGQARATHSFWSSSPMCAMSCPVRMTTWSTPPARKNSQACCCCMKYPTAALANVRKTEKGPQFKSHSACPIEDICQRRASVQTVRAIALCKNKSTE